MLTPVWDITVYLGAVQLFLLAATWRSVGSSAVIVAPARLAMGLGAAMVVFWLVWGGYSIDAWRYLSRFDRNPLHFLDEQLFWFVGIGLGRALPDPWPLKVLSALFAAGLIGAYYLYFRGERDWRFVLACLMLPAIPAFFFLGGNVIRQGLAGVIGVAAAVLLLRGRTLPAALLVVPAFLVHQYSLVIFLALGLVRYAGRWLPIIWIGAFFVSPLAREAASLVGISLDHHIAYATYVEGDFHWEKLALSGLLSLALLVSVLRHRVETPDFRHVYVALASCSHALLLYEVPFERLLLFADLVLPAALAQAGWHALGNRAMPLRLAAAGVAAASVVLWNARSVTASLGYS